MSEAAEPRRPTNRARSSAEASTALKTIVGGTIGRLLRRSDLKIGSCPRMARFKTEFLSQLTLGDAHCATHQRKWPT
jgi:hypothetical protein